MRTASSSWTLVGLLVALFGLPAIVAAFHGIVATPTDSSLAVRELLILSLTGFLLWIVTRRERLPLSSIGLRFDRPRQSVALGAGLTVALFAILIGLLAIYGALGIRYGEGANIAPSLWVTSLAVFRAGIAEEVFYRGFALERLEMFSGNKWLAAAVAVILFAGFHYRQGLPGVFLALVLGTALTGFYLWKRDLLATMTAHFLVDFVPNVALPLLGARD